MPYDVARPQTRSRRAYHQLYAWSWLIILNILFVALMTANIKGLCSAKLNTVSYARDFHLMLQPKGTAALFSCDGANSGPTIGKDAVQVYSELDAFDAFFASDGRSQMAIIWFIALLCNMYYVLKDAMAPKHPKFAIVRLFVNNHKARGWASCAECMAALGVFFNAGKARDAMLMYMAACSVIALCTSVVEIPLVFGKRRIAIPLEVAAILTKVFAWVGFLLAYTAEEGTGGQTTAPRWFLSLVLAHHIPVVARFISNLIEWEKMNITLTNVPGAESSRAAGLLYSVLLISTCVFGFMGQIFLWFGMFAWSYYYSTVLFAEMSEKDRDWWEGEMPRDPLSNDVGFVEAAERVLMTPKWKGDSKMADPGALKLAPDEDAAEMAFQLIDEDESQSISTAEMEHFLYTWGIPARYARDVMISAEGEHEGEITLAEFQKNPSFRPLWSFMFEKCIIRHGIRMRHEEHSGAAAHSVNVRMGK